MAINSRKLRNWRALVIASLSLIAAACGGSPTATLAPAATSTPTSGPVFIDAADVTPILGTTVLRPGTQRVAFLLEGSKALVTEPTVSVAVSRVGEDATAGESSEARFHLWPFGTRGTYVADLTFEDAGEWQISIKGTQIDGTVVLPVSVGETSPVLDIGQRAPFSTTKTLESPTDDVTLISSHQRPDPDLYAISVAGALFSDLPTVVVFASPSFCTSPTCGPQVDTVVDLKDAHAGEANFIHVELFDNPAEIQGDLSRGVLSPHLAEWGIDAVDEYKLESWVFVLAADGIVSSRFQGYSTLEELEQALVRAGA
jgi:hypothetical protein